MPFATYIVLIKKLNCIFDYSGSPFQSKKMSVVTVETVHTEDTRILKCK